MIDIDSLVHPSQPSPIANPGSDATEQASDRSRSPGPAAPPTASVAAPAIVGVATLIAVSLLVDVAHGAMTAAIATAIVAIVPSGHWAHWLPHRSLPNPALRAVGATACAVAGAVLVRSGGHQAETFGRLVLGWVVVLLVLTFDPLHHGRPPDRAAQLRLASIAGGVAAVAGIVSFAADAATRPALALLLATPVAVAVFVAASNLDGDRTRTTAIATAAGASVGIAALATGVEATPSRWIVVALATVTIGFLTVALAARAGVTPPGWSPRAGVALALLGAGAGGVLGIAAVGALVIVHQRDRRRPTILVADASAVTARRVVVGLTAAAVAVRLVAPRGLWLDEATSVHQARMGLVEMVRFIYETDNHPPLHHLVLWLDIRLVGDSELAVRLPAIVFGALLVPMLYVTGRALYDRRVGLLAAAIGTVAPLAVWYGQEARMYSQFMLLAIITIHAQTRILRGGGARWWVVFTAASAAAVLTQYFAVLHVGATYLVFAIELIRRRHEPDIGRLFRRTAASVVALGVALAPLVPFALNQAATNQEAGFGLTSSAATGSSAVPPPSIDGVLTNIQWAILGYQPDEITRRLVALWPIGLLFLLLMLGRRRSGSNRPLLVVAAVPAAIVFGASLFAAKSRSLAEVRYFIGAVPIVYLLLAAGLMAVFTTPRLRAVASGSLLSLLVVASAVQQTSDDNPRLYQYREAVADIREQRQPGDVVAYAPAYLDYVLEYYDPGVAARPVSAGLPDTGEGVFLVQGSSFADSAEAGAEISAAIAELEARGLRVHARADYAQMTVWSLR